MPPGGDGIYFFSTYLLGSMGEFAEFEMMLNDEMICSTYPDHNHNGAMDFAPASCTAVVEAFAGECICSIQSIHLIVIVPSLLKCECGILPYYKVV